MEAIEVKNLNALESTAVNKQYLQVFKHIVQSSEVKTSKALEMHAKYAFLDYQQWFRSNITDPTSVVNWGYAPVALDWAIYKNSTQNSMKMFELMRSRSELNLVDCYGYYDDGWYDLRNSSSHLSRFIWMRELLIS